jgi:hypothetical protein
MKNAGGGGILHGFLFEAGGLEETADFLVSYLASPIVQSETRDVRTSG